MVDWVSITGLIIAIIALAGVIGLLIWYLTATTANNYSATLQTVTGTTDSVTTGGGDTILYSTSSASTVNANIASNSSASTGKFFYIVNDGSGSIVAVGPSGSTTVIFPTTTVAPGKSATYAIVASNKYILMST